MYEKYDITENPEWNKCLNLLLDDDYSEIEANGPDLFFTKKKGKRIPIEGINLGSLERYMQGIKEGLVPQVKSAWPFRENSYLFEGPLRYTVETDEGPKLIRGRCHVVLPPAADYPQVTIAKKSTALPSLESIAERGSMSTEMLVFILAAVQANLTTAFSGGTGAGKTTMLEAVAKNFRYDIRIGVAEDAPELYLPQPNVSYLHSVPWQPGMNPNDVATLSWVVQQYQRMRTDKLIIGETRGVEFADFLVAANSGMDGSLTTLHANNPVQCLDKMSNFALRASNAPVRTINNDIATSLDLIIQLIILPDGRHRIGEICEITNTLSNDESAKITTNTLFKYNHLTDGWEKVNQMSDALRKRFAQYGVSTDPFLKSKIGAVQAPHSSPEVAQELLTEAHPSATVALPQPPTPGTGGLPVGRRL